MTNQIFVYDFTLGDEFADFESLKEWLKEHCKKWTFQLECGEETGWVHWQGRFSLKAKTRLATLKDRMPWPEVHLSPTSKCNQGNMFYVSKEDTRLDGPWMDTDKEIFIPDHLVINEFYPWEISIMEIMAEKPGRFVHAIICETGNKGKSTFVGNMCCRYLAQSIPFCNDYRDIMRMVMGLDKLGTYFIDMPRAIGKEKIRQFFAGVESIKDGYAYDDRYSFRQERFQQPHVFVFTNTWPDLTLLSADRWRFWSINEQLELTKVFHPRVGTQSYTAVMMDNSVTPLARAETVFQPCLEYSTPGELENLNRNYV